MPNNASISKLTKKLNAGIYNSLLCFMISDGVDSCMQLVLNCLRSTKGIKLHSPELITFLSTLHRSNSYLNYRNFPKSLQKQCLNEDQPNHQRRVSMADTIGQMYTQSNSIIHSSILPTLPIRECAPPSPPVLPTRCSQFGIETQEDQKTSRYHPAPCTLHCLLGTWKCCVCTYIRIENWSKTAPRTSPIPPPAQAFCSIFRT